MTLRLLNTKDSTPETVAEVDARIRANDAEAVKLTQERAAIEDDLILMDESDPALLDKISRIDVQIKVTAGRRQRLQTEHTEAQAREALDSYCLLCSQQAAAMREYHQAQQRLAAARTGLLGAEQAYNSANSVMLTNSQQIAYFASKYPDAVKALITPLKRKEIEYAAGLLNDQEIESARRQAVQLPYKGE